MQWLVHDAGAPAIGMLAAGVGKCRTFAEFKHERLDTFRIFEPVDRCDGSGPQAREASRRVRWDV